jgi:predicted component of type VI protein secretion system
VETMIGQYREKELSDLGHFLAELYLSPHFQLDELTASVRLV